MITIGEYTRLFLTIIIGLGLIFEMPILCVLPRSDAGDYGALDVAKSAIFHTCHFCSCSNRHTYHGHFEYVPFCCTDGRALRNEHRSGLAGEPLTDAEDVMSPIMILLDVKLRKCGRHSPATTPTWRDNLSWDRIICHCRQFSNNQFTTVLIPNLDR